MAYAHKNLPPGDKVDNGLWWYDEKGNWHQYLTVSSTPNRLNYTIGEQVCYLTNEVVAGSILGVTGPGKIDEAALWQVRTIITLSPTATIH